MTSPMVIISYPFWRAIFTTRDLPDPGMPVKARTSLSTVAFSRLVLKRR